MEPWCPFADKHPSENFDAGNSGRAAVVLHVGEGSYRAILGEFAPGKGKSAHFTIAKDGRIAQHVSLADSAWANGLGMRAGQWYDPLGNPVTPPWPGLVAGVNPNLYTISVEHEGYTGEPITTAMAAAQAKLLRWIAEQLAWERYVPLQNLIGHCHIAQIHRAHCPGPAFDYAAIAAAANPQPIERSFTRRYRVTAGGATIRQAWWRPGPHEGDNRVAQLAPGTLIEMDEIRFGETVHENDEWLHLADGRGFVHCSGVERA